MVYTIQTLGLSELPFNHYVHDDDFYSALSTQWLTKGVLNYEKIQSLKLPIFDTNYKGKEYIPNIEHDPDRNLDAYKESVSAMYNRCNYYIEDSFTQATQGYNISDLSLFHLNVRSLKAHENELCSYLQGLSVQFKVFGLCETWLKEEDTGIYNIENYCCEHVVRKEGRGGGVSLYIDADVKYKRRQDLNDIVSNTAEGVFIEIPKTEFKTRKNLIIGEIYRPPNTSINIFREEMESLIRKMEGENVYFYMLGDYNINLLNCENHGDTNDFLNTLYSHYCIPLINRPTRVGSHSATLIDNIVTNAIDLITVTESICGILYNDISDHYPIFFVCKQSSDYTCQNKEMCYQVINNRTLNRLKTELTQVNWNSVSECSDMNESYNRFDDIVQKCYRKCIPVKTCSRRNVKRPWVTQGILTSINMKNKMYMYYVNNPCEYTLSRYKLYKNKLTHVLRVSERTYIKDYLDKYSNDLKKSWSLMNRVIGKKNQKQTIPKEMLDVNGERINEPQMIVNGFNKYFINVGPNLAKKIEKGDVNPVSYIGNAQLCSMYAKPVNEDEILKVIGALKDSCMGYDGIKPKVIKYVKDELLQPILYMTNLSLKAGIFPDKLKTAIVTPIHKKGDHSVMSNYRPVSVLNAMSKVFERIMYNRLWNYLEKLEILYIRQYGFRKGHSTDLAILDVVDNISKALDNNQSVIAVFMDLAKAFDTINHDVLEQKLSHYGIRGSMLNWLKSYLRNRVQMVKVENTFSSREIVQCGVPQGSILGPLLFLIYINDLYKISSLLQFVLFADDTNLFIQGSDINETIRRLNHELDKIAIWFQNNQLSLNNI